MEKTSMDTLQKAIANDTIKLPHRAVEILKKAALDEGWDNYNDMIMDILMIALDIHIDDKILEAS